MGAFAPGRANGSTGLGLHLVGRFTELHGGSVRACDPPGGGTCIEVRLPLGADGDSSS
jgi:signal transduction histidine kinase